MSQSARKMLVTSGSLGTHRACAARRSTFAAWWNSNRDYPITWRMIVITLTACLPLLAFVLHWKCMRIAMVT